VLGIASDCVGGRKIEEAPVITGNAIIALGSNNWKDSPDEFRIKYQALIDRVPGRVICVLTPNRVHPSVIRSLCSNVAEAAKADIDEGLGFYIHFGPIASLDQARLVEVKL
jgi:hypothetical protein